MTNPAQTMMQLFTISYTEIAAAARQQGLSLSRSSSFRLAKNLIQGTASQKHAFAVGLARCIQNKLAHFDSSFLFPAAPPVEPLQVQPAAAQEMRLTA